MNKFLSIVLAASLCIPAVAQKSGMTNNNAPTIKQSIVAGDAKISLDYTSITWAQGQFMQRLTDKTEVGTKARARNNDMASKSPMGTFSSSTALKVGELNLPAGEYQVFFTINDDLTWNLNFAAKDKVHTTKLALMDNPGRDHKQLVMSLYAADQTTVGIYLGFGKQGGMIMAMPSNGAKEASGTK